MIHTTQGNAKRRIAVIAIPRPQKTRLGIIRPGEPARDTTNAWTTIENEPPDSSANWISYKLLEQARARETTPGTLNYTPASDTAAPNVAPWVNWLQPNCPPPGTFPPAAAPAPAPVTVPHSKLWILVGLIGAAASLKYLAGKGGR